MTTAPLETNTPRFLVLQLLLTSLVALAVPAEAGAYGWPVKPFDRQHPVRGVFGDPRIGETSHSFHFGVDVSAPDGTPVYATATGTVVRDHDYPETVCIRAAANDAVV